METDNLYINNALDWLKRAVDSLVSHKRTDEGTGFVRSSKQIIPEQKEGIFYTATFQAYSALLESAETYKAEAFGLKEMTLELERTGIRLIGNNPFTLCRFRRIDNHPAVG